MVELLGKGSVQGSRVWCDKTCWFLVKLVRCLKTVLQNVVEIDG